MRKIISVWITLILLCSVMAIPANAADGSTKVYRTSTGSCYHTSGCSYLKSKIECTLYDAVKVYSLRACSRCHPPKLDAQSTSSSTTKTTTPSTKKVAAAAPSNSATKTPSKSTATTPTTEPQKLEILQKESTKPVTSGQIKVSSSKIDRSIASQSSTHYSDVGLMWIEGFIFIGILMFAHSKKARLSDEKEELSREVSRLSGENQKIIMERDKFKADAEQVRRDSIRQKTENDRKIRELEHELQSTKENAEREVYMKLYGGKSALECAGAPTDCYISPDGYPAQMGPKKYGNRYSFFVSANGKCYHSKKGCSNASYEIHYLQAKESGKVPCSICCPIPPDLSWYEKYNDIQRIKEKYNII